MLGIEPRLTMTLSYWWQDARRAVRFLGRHPLFALGVILGTPRNCARSSRSRGWPALRPA
jgi:hypothetical protein